MPRMTGIKRDRARELRQRMTPEEAILWKYLRQHRVNDLHFRRQHVILGFIVDFYCAAACLIVEVDGPVHDQPREADAERDAILIASGYHILRISNEEVHTQLNAVLEHIHSLGINYRRSC